MSSSFRILRTKNYLKPVDFSRSYSKKEATKGRFLRQIVAHDPNQFITSAVFLFTDTETDRNERLILAVVVD